jgi:hypothetical protein
MIRVAPIRPGTVENLTRRAVTKTILGVGRRRTSNEGTELRTRPFPTIAIIAVVLLAFAAGVGAGSAGVIGVRVPASIGDGMVGEQVATIWSGDTAYGAKSSVAWRDSTGSEHEGGWPECLSTPGEVQGIRFTGAMVWHDTLGTGTILWVDCSGR